MKYLLRIIGILFLILFVIGMILAICFGHRDIPLETLTAKYANSSSSFISIEGMDVHYRDEGNTNDSLPIVLIHGTGSSLHTFDEWTKSLSVDHRVIRMDLPAYGLTGPFPDRDYSTDNYVAFIHNFLEKLEIEQCILGGNSLGGSISWNVALTYPELVKELILIDATGYPTTSESRPIAFKMATIPVIKHIFKFITPRSFAKGSIENVYADKAKVTDKLVDRYWELTLRPGNRQAFVDRINTSNDGNNHRNIPKIRQKTLVLWGDQDRLIPPDNAQRFHSDLKNDTLVILQDVGHVPMEEDPKLSLEAVRSFLADF